MIRLFIACAFLLVGCDGGAIDKTGYHTAKEDWQTAPLLYTCTTAQMDKVHKETLWCSQNTSYLSSYCYGSSFIRNCTKRQGENND